jgi:uncharacterized membrane-anchored protein
MQESTRFGTLTVNALIEAGQWDDALAEVTEAVALTVKTQADGHRAPLLRLQAEVLTRGDLVEPETARQCWRESLQLAIALEMRPEAAHCHLGLGRLCHRTGDRAKAQEHLTTAAMMYRDLGMTFWLEKAEAELRGVER